MASRPSAHTTYSEWQHQLLLALARVDAESEGAHVGELFEVAERLAPGFRPGWVRKAFREFVRRGFATGDESLGGGPDGGIYAEITGLGLQEVDRLIDEGATLLSDSGAMARIDGGTWSDDRDQTDKIEDGLVPAAGRFVRLSDNEDVRAATQALDRIIDHLQNNPPNSIFADNDERLAVIRDVESIRDSISRPVVIVASLMNAVSQSSILRWLAAAAATGAIGNYATDALNALVRLVHHVVGG